MPKIEVEVSHMLEQNVAIERIKGLLNKLKDEYGDMISDLQESWNGSGSSFSFKTLGMPVEGVLLVNNSSVKFEGKIPWAAVPFKSTIENKIKEEALKLLI